MQNLLRPFIVNSGLDFLIRVVSTISTPVVGVITDKLCGIMVQTNKVPGTCGEKVSKMLNLYLFSAVYISRDCYP